MSQKSLILTLKDFSTDKVYGDDLFSTYIFDENENKLGRNYDIYLLEGIKDIDGNKLSQTLNFTSGIVWKIK